MNLYRPLPRKEPELYAGPLSTGLGLLFVFQAFAPLLAALTTMALLALAPWSGIVSSAGLLEVGQGINLSNRYLSDILRFGVVIALGLVAWNTRRGLWIAVPLWLYVAVGKLLANAGMLRWEWGLALELGERALACATLLVVGEAFRRRGRHPDATNAIVAVALTMVATLAQLGAELHPDASTLATGLLSLAQLVLSCRVLFAAWKELPMEQTEN